MCWPKQPTICFVRRLATREIDMAERSFEIREMLHAEYCTWSAMRMELYSELEPAVAEIEAQRFLSGEDPDLKVVFLAIVDGDPVGFAELGERSLVDGCFDGPVAYLEGWFVYEQYHRSGIGRALIEQSKRWARENEYPHLASDAELSNTLSQTAHKACGFEEVDRIVQYRMKLH